MKISLMCVPSLLAASIAAQPQQGVLFTPKHVEASAQCVAAPELNVVGPDEVQLIVPNPALPPSEQFVTRWQREAHGIVRNRERSRLTPGPG